MATIMKNKKAAVVLILIAITVLSYTGKPAAQGTVDTELIRQALERTDEIIRGAQETVMDSRSQKGRLSLEKARALQKKAWELYQANRFNMALNLTLQARKEAWHAMSLARLDTQTEGQLMRTVESTYERMIRIREVIIENTIRDPQTLKLLEEAKNLLEKSTINAKQLHFQLALKLAKSSMNLTNRAEERVRTILRIKEVATRRVATMERLLERVKERVGDTNDEATRKRIAIAEKELVRAREMIREGHYRRAKRAISVTEKLLRSIARSIEPKGTENAQRRIEEAYRLIARAEEILSSDENVDPRAEEAIATARRMLEKAEDALANGRTSEAIRLAEQARKRIANTLRKAKRSLDRSTVQARIERAEELKSEVVEIIRNCPKKGVENLLDRAVNHLARAREMLSEGKFEGALSEAQIAINILERIKDICELY